MRSIVLLLICLQAPYIHSTVLFAQPLRCFLWDTKCLTALAQKLTPGYIQSIPRLGGVRLDPLEVDNIRLDYDDLSLNLKDLKIHGLENIVVDETRSYSNISMGRVLFRTDVFYSGNYNWNGTMFFKPVYGDGEFWVSLKNLEIEMFVPYNIVKDSYGVDFIEASDYKFRFDVKDFGQFHLNNLYKGNTEASELMHSLFNNNWKFVSSYYGRPFVAKILDCMAKTYKSYFRLAPLRSFVEF